MHEHDDSCMAQAMSESANCADLHEHGDDTPRASRRGLFRAAALIGAGAALAPAAPALAHDKPGKSANQGFTLVVMPDTQYLFDEDRGDSRPLDASLRWILDHTEDENIAFLTHLGDLTQNGLADEFAAIGRSFGVLDRAGAAYSVLAGNHDIRSTPTTSVVTRPVCERPGRRGSARPTASCRPGPTRVGPGLLGRTIDPHGPIRHDPGNSDPWLDTWFYSNPIFVDVR